MEYTSFLVDGKICDLTHLNPQNVSIHIDNETYNANLVFGCHCFTDEKQNGPFYRKEGEKIRYWSQDRYLDSFMLPNIIKKLLMTRSTYVTPFKPNSGREEQYHYLEDSYYAIFFYINKVNVEERTMTIYVISAYDKTTYNGTLPRGDAYKLSWVLSKRVKGEFIL